MVAGIFQMLSVLLMESISPSKSLLVAVRFTIITSTHILLLFWQYQVPTMNACVHMLEQMGDVAMEEYGEIVVLQSCWVMISLVFENLKKYQVVTE